MNKKILIILIVLFTGSAIFAQTRIIECINTGWTFHKGEIPFAAEPNIDEKDWQKINIPHTWNVDDSFDKRGVNDGWDIAYYYYRGPGWYRKWIKLDEADSEKRIHIYFEAANVVSDVYVNGKLVGSHIGGYSGFQFEITDYVKFGEINLISVRVDNSYHYDIPPQRADYTMYGGIYRDVFLIKTNKIFINQLQIQTLDVSTKSAKVKVLTSLDSKSISENLSIRFTLFDPSGNALDSKNQKISNLTAKQTKNEFDFTTVNNPNLWAPDDPTLYKLKAELLVDKETVDEVADNFGFRFFRFDADSGFFLNGNYLRLKGVNRHQDRAGYGWALSNEQHTEDMLMIKSMGSNFVRMAHYQQDEAVLDACDSLGLLVWEEIPVVTSVGREIFKNNAKQMLYEMISQHYNHPSIIVWGLMNETERSQPQDDLHWNYKLCFELNKVAKELDPTRYTTQAQMRDLGSGILKITDIRGWNRYFGWYYDTFEDFGKFMDEQKALDANQLTLISEYGAGSKLGYHKEIPEASDFTEEWQVMYHKAMLTQLEERPWIAGACVWNMFDFASEEKQGNVKHINQKGLMTWDRQPKDVFYLYQSKWTEEPMVYIVSHSWTERSGAKYEWKNIEIFSNCELVELFLNEQSLGVKSQDLTWRVQFKEGVNNLKAVGFKAYQSVSDEITINYKVK